MTTETTPLPPRKGKYRDAASKYIEIWYARNPQGATAEPCPHSIRNQLISDFEEVFDYLSTVGH